MKIQKALIQLSEYSVTQRPSWGMFRIWWRLGHWQLLCACDDLLTWLFKYEEEGCPSVMTKVGETRAHQNTYMYLFEKISGLKEYFIYFHDRVEFREEVSMEDRLELARFVRSLPEPVYSRSNTAVQSQPGIVIKKQSSQDEADLDGIDLICSIDRLRERALKMSVSSRQERLDIHDEAVRELRFLGRVYEHFKVKKEVETTLNKLAEEFKKLSILECDLAAGEATRCRQCGGTIQFRRYLSNELTFDLCQQCVTPIEDLLRVLIDQHRLDML
jgi:hypothetical protein